MAFILLNLNFNTMCCLINIFYGVMWFFRVKVGVSTSCAPTDVPHTPYNMYHILPTLTTISGKGLFCLLDLSVGDLSGSVTTIRASPLVTVGIQLKDPPNTLDLEDDRKCRINDDITLLWYDIIFCLMLLSL